MADKNIKKGDEVSWNWGSGHPSGTVAEIKTHGSLEIKSKGKRVHKNADPDNPAVHVEREGNDVVKRASELTKESSAAPTEKKDKKVVKEGTGEKKEAEAGEKRDRSEVDVGGDSKSPAEKQTEVEKETGKEAKKPKLDDEKVKEKNGGDRGNGEEKKADDTGTGPSPAPKKRGPGRPKKSEIEARKKEEAAKLESTGGAEKISQRTRSKA